MKKTVAFFFLLIFSFNILNAQDTHYWTNQYGARGSILGNSIIGSVYDNSSIYYNPGFLAFVDNSISVTADIYQYDMLKVKDGAGKGLDLKSNQTQILPAFGSGTYQFKDTSNHKFGYSILSKNKTGIKTSARIDEELDVIPEDNNSGNEEFIGQFALKSTLNEQWFGGCYSYKINDHFSLGISTFAAYRNQSMDYSYVAKVIIPTLSEYSIFVTPLLAYNDVRSIEMSTVRGIGKIGLALQYEKIDFGFTITTPSLAIYGNSTIQRDELVSNLNQEGLNFSEYTKNTNNYKDYILACDSFRFDLSYNSYTTNDRQSSATDNLKTVYKSPLSIAAGIVFKAKKINNESTPRRKLYLSFEYFNSIEPYYLIEPEERGVIRPIRDNYTYNSIDYMGIIENPRGLLNIAIGYEQRLSEKFSLLASFRTNNSFSNINFNPEVNLSQTFWNLIHYSVGVLYKRKASEVTIGLSYSDAFGGMDPYVIMSNPSEVNFLQGDDYYTLATFRSISFSIGYNFYLKSKN
jgi:hypothetical protein